MKTVTVQCEICSKTFEKGIHAFKRHPKSCCSKQCLNKYLSKIRLGNQNPNWSDKPIIINSLHSYVKRRLAKPDKCPSCHLVKRLDLANIADKPNPETYTRDLKNWEWLCRKCHMEKDGRLNNFLESTVERRRRTIKFKVCPYCKELKRFYRKYQKHCSRRCALKQRHLLNSGAHAYN
jgi:rubrerythrin